MEIIVQKKIFDTNNQGIIKTIYMYDINKYID